MTAMKGHWRLIAVLGLLVVVAIGGYRLLGPSAFERAEGMYRRGDYVSAFQLYLRLANEGDARAQFAVSRIYTEGLGRKIHDPQEGVQWLIRSAERGYPFAALELGDLYFAGDFLEQDLERAEFWWGRAADANLFGAWERLQNLYPLEGEAAGVFDKKLRNMEDNAGRLAAYAEKGQAWAQVVLGQFYLRGRGVERDAARARRLFLEAAETNSPYALFALAQTVLAVPNEAGEAEIDEAVQRLTAAAGQGYSAAALALADDYEQGVGVDVDREEALFWTVVGYRLAPGEAPADKGEVVGRRRAGLSPEALERVRARANEWSPKNWPRPIEAAKGMN